MDWDRVDELIDEAMLDVLSYKLKDIANKDERLLSKARHMVQTPYGIVDKDTGELIRRNHAN